VPLKISTKMARLAALKCKKSHYLDGTKLCKIFPSDFITITFNAMNKNSVYSSKPRNLGTNIPFTKN
jgi:hypothetical protein